MMRDGADKMYRNLLVAVVFAHMPVEKLAQTVCNEMLNERMLDVFAEKTRKSGEV